MRCFNQMMGAVRLVGALLACGVAGEVIGAELAPTGEVTLAWNASSEAGVAGYKVYYGTASCNYTELLDVGNTTVAELSGLTEGATYYCNVTAYNSDGLEGEFSEEMQFTYDRVVGDEVEISGQSESQAVMIGNGVSLEVTAIGSGELTYQWFKDGVLMPGATNRSLVFGVLEAGDTGWFWALVPSGTANSTTEPMMLVAAIESPRIKAIGRTPEAGGGQLISLELDGAIGADIHVFVSDDLERWEWLSSGFNDSGAITVSDTDCATAGRRFYRVAASGS